MITSRFVSNALKSSGTSPNFRNSRIAEIARGRINSLLSTETLLDRFCVFVREVPDPSPEVWRKARIS
jgi:hypothetical protein